jgi:hypothetical protein
MNYIYELKYEIGLKKEKMFFVYESENKIKSRVSSIKDILFSVNRKEFKNSQLERMYMWLKENHPELLI